VSTLGMVARWEYEVGHIYHVMVPLIMKCKTKNNTLSELFQN